MRQISASRIGLSKPHATAAASECGTKHWPDSFRLRRSGGGLIAVDSARNHVRRRQLERGHCGDGGAMALSGQCHTLYEMMLFIRLMNLENEPVVDSCATIGKVGRSLPKLRQDPTLFRP
jgi:hypothetical protein